MSDMSEHLKGLKINKHFDTPDPTIPKFTEEDFKEAMSNTPNLYMDTVNTIIELESKMTDQAIFDSCRDCLGCKSADDVYNLMTTEEFVHFNEIVTLINERIKAYVGSLGPWFASSVTQIRTMSKPLVKSDEMLKLYRERWDVLYNNEEENCNEN